MNSSSSSLPGTLHATLCELLEYQKARLTELIETIEKRKKELDYLLKVINDAHSKKKKK